MSSNSATPSHTRWTPSPSWSSIRCQRSNLRSRHTIRGPGLRCPCALEQMKYARWNLCDYFIAAAIEGEGVLEHQDCAGAEKGQMLCEIQSLAQGWPSSLSQKVFIWHQSFFSFFVEDINNYHVLLKPFSCFSLLPKYFRRKCNVLSVVLCGLESLYS